MLIKEGEPVVSPELHIELPTLRPRLGDREPFEYPRTEFIYNRMPVKINVKSGVGALALQQVGTDEETRRVSRDVVNLFHCLRIEKTSGSFEIPADYWYFIANIGSIPLKLTIDSSPQFSHDQLEAIKKTMPQIAFTLVQENNNPALLPTCRVGRVKRVTSKIPYAQEAR